MREKCYKCMRPQNSCMCRYLSPIQTQTKFVLLMHPHEFKKVKNGTGRMTSLQLKNSEITQGINFDECKEVNQLIEDYNCFLLYPGKNSFNISRDDFDFKQKNNLIFIIDATWQCAKKMLKLSPNLQRLPRLSFDSNIKSQFIIKQQPHHLCLSTIESTHLLLKNLISRDIENINLDTFLKPFEKMIEFQIECINNPNNKHYRPTTERNIKNKIYYRQNAQRALFYDDENF